MGPSGFSGVKISLNDDHIIILGEFRTFQYDNLVFVGLFTHMVLGFTYF